MKYCVNLLVRNKQVNSTLLDLPWHHTESYISDGLLSLSRTKYTMHDVLNHPLKSVSPNNLRRFAGNSLFRMQNFFGRYKIESLTGSVAVLMYHGLQSSAAKLSARPLDIEPAHCLAEILFFRKQGYQLIAPHQLDDLPAHGNYLIVTFDDGHQNIHAHLMHWMQKYEVPFTLAVCPDLVESQTPFWWEEVRARFDLAGQKSTHSGISNKAVEMDNTTQFLTLASSVSNQQRLLMMQQLREQTDDVSSQDVRNHDAVHANMTWAQLRVLASNPLCTLASHSRAHEFVTQLDIPEFIDNAIRSRQAIENNTGREVCDFVYPNGKYNTATDRALQQAGYLRWFSLGEKLNSPWHARGHLFRFRGYGFGSDNLRYFAHLWKQRHDTSPAESKKVTAKSY